MFICDIRLELGINKYQNTVKQSNHNTTEIEDS